MVKVKLLALEKSFASHPRAAFWSDRNEENPDGITLRNSHKYWFRCDICPHEFLKELRRAAEGSWCPYCAGQLRCGLDQIKDCQMCWNKSFAVAPRAVNWSAKNEDRPCDYALGSHRKAWFQCDSCPHEFFAELGDITGGGWCPFCAGRQRCPPATIQSCANCWKKTFASHGRSSCWSNRNESQPCEVALYSAEKYWFSCNVCCHEFRAALHNVSGGTFCPFCDNQKRCPPDFIKYCDFCWGQTFATHPKAIYWSERNSVLPHEVALKCNKKFWFRCGDCPHEFERSLNSVSANCWCPFCSNQKRCPPENMPDCAACYAKSFAVHEKAALWADRNDLRPCDVGIGSTKAFWISCPTCTHQYEIPVVQIVAGRGCPFCYNKRRCAPEIIADCLVCWNKSFASHWRAAFWDQRNTVLPCEVAMACGRSFYFRCDRCEEQFEAPLSDVYRGRWCPFCSVKTAAMILTWLRKWYQQHVDREARYEWCGSDSSKHLYPFDFHIGIHKVLIELDGVHHFMDSKHFKSTAVKSVQRDVYKMKLALDHGFRFIRISQEDVWKSPEVWKERLKAAIESTERVHYLAEKPSLYNAHKAALEVAGLQ